MTGIVLATEDELSEQIGLRLVGDVSLHVDLKLRKNGNGYLKSRIENFCEMAKHKPVLLITDLDSVASVKKLKAAWLNTRQPPKLLLFHVAVREAEAWLLADHAGMKKLLGKKVNKFPPAPEELSDPKAHLLALAANASREIRDELVVERNSVASQGLGYNAILTQFVQNEWDPEAAENRSDSLAALRKELAYLAEADS